MVILPFSVDGRSRLELILDWLAAAQLLRRDAGNLHDLLPQGQFTRESRIQFLGSAGRGFEAYCTQLVAHVRFPKDRLDRTLRRSTISPGVLAGTSINVYVSSTKPG